jgi:glycosyltransferase involved in cell wall biosynthesis
MVNQGQVKPEILYLSPVIPGRTGNGLAMRAGTVLEGLAECYSISLLVVALYPPFITQLPPEFARLCRRSAITFLTRRSWRSFLTRSQWTGPLSSWRKLAFDLIHVFRLAMVPYAWKFMGRRARRPLYHLDLDDIESVTHARIAALCRLNGDESMALFEEFQSERNQRMEEAAFTTFDRIYVCSELDRATLSGRTGAELCVLPNAVKVPVNTPPAGNTSLLFVGTLGYYPNDDGARYLCDEIVPRIHKQSTRDFQVNIIGGGASDRLREAAVRAGARIPGCVSDLEAWYRGAAVVIVPVRAGGGTRIKILEAFAYRRPVVATPAGIEGIDAVHGEHALIGSTPDELACHCARLLNDVALRERLVSNARSLLERRYSADVFKRTIASLVPSALRQESRSGGALPVAR